MGVGALVPAFAIPAVVQEKTSGPWVMESSGTTAGLRGIHAGGGGVTRASGTGGTAGTWPMNASDPGCVYPLQETGTLKLA